MLLNSKKVKIEGLGTFYTTLECQKGGAVTKEKFSVLKDVKGLHIRFLPEQEQEQNISSRESMKSPLAAAALTAAAALRPVVTLAEAVTLAATPAEVVTLAAVAMEAKTSTRISVFKYQLL